MFIDKNLKTAHPDELITLHELMFRWPCEPIHKICYELYTNRFTNMIIEEIIEPQPADEKGEECVCLFTMPWNLDQKSLCRSFNKLVVFKKEVEAAECDNPLYTAVDTINSRNPWHQRCTKENYRRIAPLILHVNFMLVSYPPPTNKLSFRAHTWKFIDSDEILSSSNCLAAPKKDWIIPEDAAIPLLRAKPLSLPLRTEIDHDFLATIISDHRARGITDEVELCRILLEHAPTITGASITRHIHNIIPKNEREKEAAKKKGNRLKKAVLEKSK